MRHLINGLIWSFLLVLWSSKAADVAPADCDRPSRHLVFLVSLDDGKGRVLDILDDTDEVRQSCFDGSGRYGGITPFVYILYPVATGKWRVAVVCYSFGRS